MRNHNNDTIITTTQSFRKIYLSLYLKGLCVRGSRRPNRTATYWPPLLWPLAFLSRSPGLLNRRSRGPALRWVLAFSNTSISKLSDFQTNWLSGFTELYNSSTPTQSPPTTGHQNMHFPPSLEWHVWSSSCGNNCHAVHRSLSSGASVLTVPWYFNPVPYCQPSSPAPMKYALPPSLEWHVWRGRRSIYNTQTSVKDHTVTRVWRIHNELHNNNNNNNVK